MTKINDYIAELEASEQTELNKEEVIETLKGFAKRSAGERRGQLAGLQLEDMSDDQLKRELINAKSVLYKAEQRKAGEETIARNQARVDAAEAEKAKRTPVKEEEATEGETADGVYADQAADVDVDTANEL